MSDVGTPESVEPGATDASQQVLEFRNQHMTAMTDRRDMQRILSHFTEDAVYVPPVGEAVVGREVIHAYLADFFSSGLFGVDFDNHQTLVDSDLAVRRVDGEWRITLVLWSEQTPG